MTIDRPTNPMFAPRSFKVGLFGYLHQGGMALTKAPERWSADWDDIAKMASIADQGGLDFLLPISSWKGWRGEIEHRRKSFETLTHAAALASITKRIGLFSTVHAPLIHPVFVAKALATIDHVSHGRAGLNIVCGWNTVDFDMFGVAQLPHDARYEHGQEWYDILSRIIADGSDDFDYDGKYISGRNIGGKPYTHQQPQPATISAAYSPAGRDFAVRTSDFILTMYRDFDSAVSEVEDIRQREAALDRKLPLGVLASTTICCRENRKEAEEFNHYYAVEMADKDAAYQFVTERSTKAAAPAKSMEASLLAAAGGARLIGTPEDIVEGFVKLQKAGFAGTGITTLNFLDDLPLIINRVLPLMAKAGLR